MLRYNYISGGFRYILISDMRTLQKRIYEIVFYFNNLPKSIKIPTGRILT